MPPLVAKFSWLVDTYLSNRVGDYKFTFLILFKRRGILRMSCENNISGLKNPQACTAARVIGIVSLVLGSSHAFSTASALTITTNTRARCAREGGEGDIFELSQTENLAPLRTARSSYHDNEWGKCKIICLFLNFLSPSTHHCKLIKLIIIIWGQQSGRNNNYLVVIKRITLYV